MSIVRIGLAENKGFANGYDAIFGKGKKKPAAAAKAPTAAAKVTPTKPAKGKPAPKAAPAAVTKPTVTTAKSATAKKK